MSDLGAAAYLDASALVKLIRPEPESDAMVAWLESSELHLTASEVVQVELMRAVRRTGPDLLQRARALTERLILLPLTANIRDRATLIDPTSVRALDAIHIATAIEVRPHLNTLVTYDKRMSEAALGCGLPVLSPGI